MNLKKVEEFTSMMAQLEAMHGEMAALVKNGADKPVNAFKVRLANSILASANKILGSSKPELGLEAFDEVDLPTASDISFVLRLYAECAEKVRQGNIEKHSNNVWYWKGLEERHVTTPPKVSK